MSDLPEDLSGATQEVSEPVGVWRDAGESPAWEKIVDQAQPAAPGSAEPGAAPQQQHAPAEAQDPSTETEATAVQPATAAGRSRRPTSLREHYVQDSESVPRRKLAAPAFPSAPPVPGSRWAPPAETTDPQGDPVPASSPAASDPPQAPAGLPRLPNPAPLLGKIPTGKIPTDKVSMDKLPLDKLPTDKLPLDQLRTLTRQRPEVGLGLAFAGGLVIATILKRLGRR